MLCMHHFFVRLPHEAQVKNVVTCDDTCSTSSRFRERSREVSIKQVASRGYTLLNT